MWRARTNLKSPLGHKGRWWLRTIILKMKKIGKKIGNMAIGSDWRRWWWGGDLREGGQNTSHIFYLSFFWLQAFYLISLCFSFFSSSFVFRQCRLIVWLALWKSTNLTDGWVKTTCQLEEKRFLSSFVKRAIPLVANNRRVIILWLWVAIKKDWDGCCVVWAESVKSLSCVDFNWCFITLAGHSSIFRVRLTDIGQKMDLELWSVPCRACKRFCGYKIPLCSSSNNVKIFDLLLKLILP